ncbi:MAG: MraY family glycosyltransferase [Atopobiaceae bacterium]|uniref:MraY family glycosyltransferase n=1 Tax=Olsenella absiana TaxID=3115222 RepID=A0ABU7R7Q5_9ACTN|nr:MraY family glycosyltransferase [Olsenella sp.]MDD7365450.1 MraY family glycosyltransferase [Olsenella sp.]MDY3901613.1 MraY family glycosyltransferase [Atopobiaceae bacterium]
MLRWWLPFLAVFAASFLVTLATTPLARRIAWRLRAVDYPAARRVNKRPVPRMGGIAIVCGLVAGELVQALGVAFLGWPRVFVPVARQTVNYWLLFLSFLVIFLTGLVDDKFTLTPRQKLLGQVVASVVAVASGLVIDEIVNPLQNSVIHLGLAAMPITVVFLVAYTNIFNLIDGLDGLASGIACIAGLTMWIVSTISGRLDAAVLAIMISGTTLAFLRYNFHPASIFLGDSGALLIGFALGTVSLLSVSRVSGLTAIIIPLVVAGIPIIDTFSAIVRRGRAHVSIGHADKGHIHHRLMSVGLGQRQTALVIYAWTAALCVGSVVMTQVEVFPRICIFVALVVASGAFASRLRLFRPVLLHHRDPKTGEDELVTPQDPAFEQEREKFDEQHHQLGE